MAKIIDIVGKKFSRLTVLRFDSVRGRRDYFWYCRCDCGTELAVRGTHLRAGRTKSCRCVHGIRIDFPVTQEQLKKLLRYKSSTGEWWWRVSNRKNKAGDRAGFFNKSTGYMQIGLGGHLYNMHVLAWLYMKGKFIPEIDHKNTVRSDNKWRNLRKATHQQNCVNSLRPKNNTTGYKGVARTSTGRFRAYFRGRHIGVFGSAISAARAYDIEARRQFGRYARGNFGLKDGRLDQAKAHSR